MVALQFNSQTVNVGGIEIPITSQIRAVTVEEVIRVSACEDAGAEGDVYRLVDYWFTRTGELIARRDDLPFDVPPPLRDQP